MNGVNGNGSGGGGDARPGAFRAAPLDTAADVAALSATLGRLFLRSRSTVLTSRVLCNRVQADRAYWLARYAGGG